MGAAPELESTHGTPHSAAAKVAGVPPLGMFPVKALSQHGWRAGPTMCCGRRNLHSSLPSWSHLNYDPATLSEPHFPEPPTLFRLWSHNDNARIMQVQTKTAHQHVSPLIKHHAVRRDRELSHVPISPGWAGKNVRVHLWHLSLGLALAWPPWTTLAASWESRARATEQWDTGISACFCKLFYVFVRVSQGNVSWYNKIASMVLWGETSPFTEPPFSHSSSVHPKAIPGPSPHPFLPNEHWDQNWGRGQDIQHHAATSAPSVTAQSLNKGSSRLPTLQNSSPPHAVITIEQY